MKNALLQKKLKDLLKKIRRDNHKVRRKRKKRRRRKEYVTEGTLDKVTESFQSTPPNKEFKETTDRRPTRTSRTRIITNQS